MTEKEFDRYCTGHLVRGVAKDALRRRWMAEGKLEKPVPPKKDFVPLDPELEGMLLINMGYEEKAKYLKDKAEYERSKKKNGFNWGRQAKKQERPEDFEGYTYIKPKPRKQSEKVETMSDEEIDALANMKDGALD